MISRRKMIDALLLLESALWWLASTTANFIWTTGQELVRFVVGRRGRRLLSHREIYARNITRTWEIDGSHWPSCGIYIRRVGRLGTSRWLGVGQVGKDAK
jgi:hypothetical protein